MSTNVFHNLLSYHHILQLKEGQDNLCDAIKSIFQKTAAEVFSATPCRTYTAITVPQKPCTSNLISQH